MAARSPEELAACSIMDPTLEAELNVWPVRDPQPSDPYYGRKDFFSRREHRAARLREMHHLRHIPTAIPGEVQEHDREIPVRNGNQYIRVRIYIPVQKPSGGSPLIVMYHEGGWSMGDLSDEEVNCRMFARDLGAVCVNVDYRLAPEHRFPTGINDSWDALKWAARNASSLGADTSAGFLIGGGSAGGNITAVLAHLARDEQLSPALTGQYLCVPAIMCLLNPEKVPAKYRPYYLSHPSITPNIDPVLKTGSDDDIASFLGASMDNPLFVPFLYGEREQGHRHLPPAYLQVAGLDPLRDEGLIYAQVLEEAGVKVKVDLYPGFGHYFWTNFPRLETSQKFVKDTREGVKWLLSNGHAQV